MRLNPVLCFGVAAFVAVILATRYIVAPAIVQHGGLAGTLLALAVIFCAGAALDRR